MPTWIKLVCIALYLIDVIATLNAIRLDNKKYYAITKSTLMPLLLVSYLVCLPENLMTLTLRKFVLLAFICYTAGDVLLLFPKDKTLLCFYIGMLSFYIGHVFLIAWYAQKCWTHSTTVMIVAAVLVLLLEIEMFRVFTKRNKKMGLALVLYSSSLAVLTIAAASVKTVSGTLGVLIFLVSDYTIARRELKMKTTGNMFTMSTYIVAQTLTMITIYTMQVSAQL